MKPAGVRLELLAEHGVVIGRDISRLRRALSQIVEGSECNLGDLIQELASDIHQELAALDEHIASYDRRIRNLFRTNEMCQRIGKIEGIGPITATALVAAVGDQSCFKNGRQFAAWLGLVPKQRSSGGKSRLFGISKRGDRYLRTLLIHGARAVLGKAGGKQDARSVWINRMRERRHPNVVAVALANKNARIVWSILSKKRGVPRTRNDANSLERTQTKTKRGGLTRQNCSNLAGDGETTRSVASQT